MERARFCGPGLQDFHNTGQQRGVQEESQRGLGVFGIAETKGPGTKPMIPYEEHLHGKMNG